MNPVKTKTNDPDSIRDMVSDRYGSIANKASSTCCSSTSCCGSSAENQIAEKLGYSSEALRALPDGANLGLGCGNPTAIDSLKPGEVVVDLGSGAGIDVFLAAREVGPGGRVIGIDMTESMLQKARQNAATGGYENVEFRKGKIEELPVQTESVDAIISNCVINLSPEKEKVFKESFRVLKPGGRLMISDIVLNRPLPPEVLTSADAWASCIGGAILREEYLSLIRQAGFSEIQVERETRFDDALPPDDPSVRAMAKEYGVDPDSIKDITSSVTSLSILAKK